jgi:hypothetical protein
MADYLKIARAVLAVDSNGAARLGLRLLETHSRRPELNCPLARLTCKVSHGPSGRRGILIDCFRSRA